MNVSRFGHFFFLLALGSIVGSIIAFFKEGFLKGALWLGGAAVCWFIGFYHDLRLLKRGHQLSDLNRESVLKNTNDTYEIMFMDNNNPAFNELIHKYSMIIAPYSLIADKLIEEAIHSSVIFANAN
jgi:hypothetical protein